MFHAGEVRQTFAHHGRVYAGGEGSGSGGQGVAEVVAAGKGEFAERHFEVDGCVDDELVAVGVARRTFARLVGKSAALCLNVVFGQFVGHMFVLGPIDERVVGRLVLTDAHLGVYVVLHAEVVAVEVVGGDVEEHRHVGAEAVHVVELEGRKLNDVVGMGRFGYLKGEAMADVPGEADVHAGFLHDVVDERGGGGFAVRTRDANHAGVGVASGKFYLAEYGRAFLDELFHHGSRFGDTGTFYGLVGIEDKLGSVVSLFPCNVVGGEHLFIAWLNASHVGNKHVVTFFLRKNGSANAAFGSA